MHCANPHLDAHAHIIKKKTIKSSLNRQLRERLHKSASHATISEQTRSGSVLLITSEGSLRPRPDSTTWNDKSTEESECSIQADTLDHRSSRVPLVTVGIGAISLQMHLSVSTPNTLHPSEINPAKTSAHATSRTVYNCPNLGAIPTSVTTRMDKWTMEHFT